jgi:hypothetical protein
LMLGDRAEEFSPGAAETIDSVVDAIDREHGPPEAESWRG